MNQQKEKHKRIQAKMHTQEEWDSIELAAQILDGKMGFYCFARIISTTAKTVNDIERATDVGDILLFNRKTSDVRIAEVKRLSNTNYLSDFIDRATWLAEDFIVDGVYQFDRKLPVPYIYLCFNYPLTAVALIKTRTFKNWKIRKAKGNESIKEYYVAELNDVMFFSVEELLKQNNKNIEEGK